MTRSGRCGNVAPVGLYEQRRGAVAARPAVTSSRQELSTNAVASLRRQICSASSGLSMGFSSPSAAMPCDQAGDVLVEEHGHAADQLERLVEAEAVRERAVGGRQCRLGLAHEHAVEDEHRHGESL